MAYSLIVAKIKVICDQCRKSQTHTFLSDKPVRMHYARYAQGNGYYFYATVCNEKCREKWGEAHPGLTFVGYEPQMFFDVRLWINFSVPAPYPLLGTARPTGGGALKP